MRLNSLQLNNFLQKNLAPIYLISGDETLLVNEVKNNIYTAGAQREFNHREILHVENNSSIWQDFATLAYNCSLFAEKQIIEVRFTQAKPGNIGSKMLIEYAQKPPSDNILLLVMPKVDAATQKTQWFKTLEQKAVVVQVWPPEAKQLPGWINAKAQQLGLRLDHNCATILAEYTRGNLVATQQELAKLVLLYGTILKENRFSELAQIDPSSLEFPRGGEERATGVYKDIHDCRERRCQQSGKPKCEGYNASISEKQLISSLHDNSRFNVFDLIDAIYETPHPQQQVINILEHLKAEDDSTAPLILWAITREIRLLINCKTAERDQQRLDQCLNSGGYRLKPERKNQIKKIINKFMLSRLEEMLCLAGDIDQMIKGIKNDDTWRNLQRIMLMFKT